MTATARTPTTTKRKMVRLDRFAGEWVVLVQDRVVAHDKTLATAMDEAGKKGVADRASVFLVPRKDEGPYVLVIV